ncbi:putative metal-dependent hydrolase [Mucilaginibacter pallidiroseus]|uniref:Putative metal-dependent hydrolase n=1 Tax=Mucilaginibacter pallidiroseus TaxID=2599295 RepID=A0A563UEB9_9SPHI|nr:putative metal-dependent hydrolase [Mucilaginibacter pallidiroseus]TWR29712.1 putative metal-dependent hydrolase [Mucilaginibacter pallidiroseus]
MLTDKQMRFPIGKFKAPLTYIAEDKRRWISEIKLLPGQLRNVVMPLTERQLDTQYRTGGWTLRQVVHHLADSHMNSLTRFKLALTEDTPIIKPYEEGDWALLPDYRLAVEPSLRMLEGIHQHMTTLFESFTDTEWNLSFIHPASGETVPLKKAVATYAWHGKHHLAHITETIRRF